MDTLLNQIQSPHDLKKLKITDLKTLASEVRERIIKVLSVNGGHLASNLGSIELSIALHYVFDSPLDKFIFDVSHQTYTHKLLTGRNDHRFDKIRKPDGLSGFAHPKESEHDHFFAGHAGTALSLALGMAASRDLSNQNSHIIPVIGDATLTCGLSLEALNNIKKDLTKFIVILNDNEMSISKNVGRISHILSRLLSNPTTSKLTHELESLVSKIPVYGSSLAKQGMKLAGSVKNIVSSAPFFEQFGLSYIGPIDGHDLKKLIPILQSLKNLPMPLVVHVLTKKGFGMERAENDPINYHGAKPFDPKTCEFLPSSSKKPTFPKIFGKHLLKMGEEDKDLAVITPAMSLGSCLDPFRDKFPERFFDVGIAEGHAVSFAGGLGKEKKLRVICSVYSTFLQRAFDNLFHDVCLQEIPVVFAIDRAGLATADGATHHGIYDISFLRAMPNMVICQPRDGLVLVELMNSAFDWQRPVAIRYPNTETEPAEGPCQKRLCGKGEILADGRDILLISLGQTCSTALAARQLLLEQGFSATVMDPVFIKPLDTELLSKLLLTHSYIVTLEEHSLKGGLATEVNEFLFRAFFDQIQVLNLGIPETFVEHGTHKGLLSDFELTPEKVVKRLFTHFSLTPAKISAQVSGK